MRPDRQSFDEGTQQYGLADTRLTGHQHHSAASGNGQFGVLDECGQETVALQQLHQKIVGEADRCWKVLPAGVHADDHLLEFTQFGERLRGQRSFVHGISLEKSG